MRSISNDKMEECDLEDLDDLLDEIHGNEDESKQQSKINKSNQSNPYRMFSRQITFTALKNSVFNDLEEQDHIEQERITWYKLKQWVEFEWFDKLYRNNVINAHYTKDIKEAKINYRTYTDKILIKYFDCPFTADNNNQKASAFITNKTNDDAFIHFNFPYYFAKGLHHYVLFSRCHIMNLSPKQMRRLISNYIDETEFKNYEFVYYEERDKLSFFQNETFWNKVPLLSEIVDANLIPNIIHVFIKETDVYRITLGNNATWADQSFLWEEACTIVKNQDMEKFGREEKWLRKYVQDRTKSKKPKTDKETNVLPKRGFNSIRDKILIREFMCKSEINPENDKLKAIVDETTPRLQWTVNLYPYFFQEGIEHHLVWYLDEKVDKTVLEAYIKKNLGDRQYIYWENPLHLKSIPDLDHYQVLSVDMNEYMANIKSLLYQKTAYKWEVFAENTSIVENHESDVKFGWKERVCRRYLEEMEETKMRFESIYDADLRRYFKCEIKKNEFGKLVIDEADKVYSEYDHDRYVFVTDRYPFPLEAGLKQYLLVILDKDEWKYDKVKQILKFELGVDEANESKFVFWKKIQNGKEEKPYDLWYYHVIHNNNE
eukprot:1144995_1